MSNKCLVTKLPGSVSDDTLPKLNEWVFDVVKRPNVDNVQSRSNNCHLSFKASEPITLSVVGDAYFTNANSANLGKSIVSDGTTEVIVKVNSVCKLKISNKYLIQNLGAWSNSLNYYQGFFNSPLGTTSACNWMLRISTEEFKYTALKVLDLGSAHLYGDIKNINTENISVFRVIDPYVSTILPTNEKSELFGDGNILAAKGLTVFAIAWSKVVTDLSKVDFSKMLRWELTGSKLTGAIDNANWTRIERLNISVLTEVNLNKIGYQPTGDICKAIGTSSENAHEVFIKACDGFTDNIGLIPEHIFYLTNEGGESEFEFVQMVGRRTILALNGIKVSQVDALLNYMATLSMRDGAYYKMINLRGVRTALSDQAVATLQEKGFTVSVTNN